VSRQSITATVLVCLLLVAAGLALSSCGTESAPTTSGLDLPAAQPADFGFVAAFGPYGRNIIDTFAGTFTKDIISQTKPNPTAELELTAEELATLYQDLRAMHILDFPADLDPGNTRITASTPATYRLELRVGGTEKTIFWGHGDFPETQQAQALHVWFKKLRQMIESKPEYQRMPPLEGGYS
jgi:hypothetical protein